jgi:hypothetical protein
MKWMMENVEWKMLGRAAWEGFQLAFFFWLAHLAGITLAKMYGEEVLLSIQKFTVLAGLYIVMFITMGLYHSALINKDLDGEISMADRLNVTVSLTATVAMLCAWMLV